MNPGETVRPKSSKSETVVALLRNAAAIIGAGGYGKLIGEFRDFRSQSVRSSAVFADLLSISRPAVRGQYPRFVMRHQAACNHCSAQTVIP